MRPMVFESGKLYRSNLKEDVPFVLSLPQTNFWKKLRLQCGVEDLYANRVYPVGDPTS